MDTGAAFTGGAGNDTFNATVATLGSLDVVDAGAGTDTLSVVETNSITTWGDASLSGFEKAVVTTAGSIGSIKASPVDVAARAQISALSFSNTFAAGDTITVQIGTATYTATVGSLSTSHGRDEAITAVKGGCTEFCVNGLMAGNRRTSWREDDRKFKESSTQRAHRQFAG